MIDHFEAQLKSPNRSKSLWKSSLYYMLRRNPNIGADTLKIRPQDVDQLQELVFVGMCGVVPVFIKKD